METAQETECEGANDQLQLSHVHSNVETSLNALQLIPMRLASIEPRSFERGNILSVDGLVLGDVASIEPRSFERGNIERASHRRLPCQASIEPRSFERGNYQIIGIVTYLSFASIEPRSFERGNALLVRFSDPELKALQLSHVHSNVETTRSARIWLEDIPLQLSHVHSNVETPWSGAAKRSGPVRFN